MPPTFLKFHSKLGLKWWAAKYVGGDGGSVGRSWKTWQISTQEIYYLLPDPQTPTWRCLQVYKYISIPTLLGSRHTLVLFPDCGP